MPTEGRSRRPRRRDATWKLVLAFVTPLVIAVGVVVVLSRSDTGSEGATTGPGGARPNVLVIMTDDQTLESMRVMENTKRLLAEKGTTFSNHYVSFPNCCPSRASFLTGQYAHNNGVTDNVAPEGGFAKLNSNETLPVWLQRAGYYTASVGKYLNGWGQDGIQPPPGWTHWYGLIDPSTYHYFNYSVSDDGTRKDFGSDEKDYQTDVLGAEVTRTIGEAGKTGKPWFVAWTPLATHGQYSEQRSEDAAGGGDTSKFPVPAARHKGRFATERLPKPPAYDQADMSGAPPVLQTWPRVGDEQRLEQLYRTELETLLSVDEWVGNLVQTLSDTGQLDRTVIVFTSDNGVFHGEHRLQVGKIFLYEPASHVPLIITGGSFPKGKTVDAVTVNVDLAPTILALAGGKAGVPQDGRDLAPVAQDPSIARDRLVLLESWLGRARPTRLEMKGVHGERYVLIRDSDGWTGLYDLEADPGQVFNKVDDPALAAVKADLSAKLDLMKNCAGQACEVTATAR